MKSKNSIPLLRSQIAMFLHSNAGDPSARALLAEAETLLMQAEIDLRYWIHRAGYAESLREAEVDDDLKY